MNKKLLTLLGVAFMAVSTGCNNTNTTSSSSADEGFSTTVLADSEYHGWYVHGQNQVGDLVNGWDDKANEVYEATKMTAASLNDVAQISEEVATTLKAKGVKYLYTIDVTFGVNDAGWTTNVMKNDGKKYTINGSYAFKVGKVSYSAELDIYSTSQWISDPHTAHAEAVNNNVFVPTWTETDDENGFNWGHNPACIGGAGTYTLIAAQYNAVSASDTPGYGFALVLKEAGTAATEDVEVLKYVADDHTYGLVGSFAASNWGASDDIAMTGENGTYTAEITLAENEEFKVRADSEWTYSWGANAVVSSPEGAFTLPEDGNIVCAVAGTYTVTISNFTEVGGAEITIVAA